MVCPVAAISIVDTLTPSIDERSCIGCGACTAVCPTQALTETTDLIRSVGRTCRSIDGGLTLACSANPYPSSGSVVELGACLASLDAPALIEFSAGGTRPVFLDGRRCPECPIGSLAEQIGVAVTEANLVLAAVNRPPVIEMLESPSAMESAIAGSGERIGGTHLSRRGLLGLLGGDKAGISNCRSSPEVPPAVPGRRRRLLGSFRAWEVADHAELETAGTSFASVEVDPMTCSMCGLCATFCPTGALTMVEDVESPGEVILGFTASFCLDCGICSVACPEQAIGFGPTVKPAAIARMSVTRLLRDRLLCCGKCGLPTRRRSEDPTVICFSCRQGAGPVDSLRDGAGLMGDLLNRIDRRTDSASERYQRS